MTWTEPRRKTQINKVRLTGLAYLFDHHRWRRNGMELVIYKSFGYRIMWNLITEGDFVIGWLVLRRWYFFCRGVLVVNEICSRLLWFICLFIYFYRKLIEKGYGFVSIYGSFFFTSVTLLVHRLNNDKALPFGSQYFG